MSDIRDVAAGAATTATVTDEAVGPQFGLLSQPYKGAVKAMRDVRRAPPITDPRISEGLTDFAHAERLRDRLAHRLKHDHQRRIWLRWDRHRWVEDKTGERISMAIEVARDLYLEAGAITNLPTKEAVAAFAVRCESRHAIDNVLEILKYLPPISERGDRWNSNPLEINTPSGIVNLKTKSVRDATPTDLVTYSTGALYHPYAECPTWEATVLAVMNDDAGMAAFYKRAIGYSFTGMMNEQAFFMSYGRGGNGKSTLQETIAAVAGDYYYATPFTTFEAGQRTTIGNDLAALPGRRMVVASEVNSGTRLNTARVKAITGGDRLNARHLYGHAFEFTRFASCG